MKKKSLVLALAMLALVGCDTKKDDTKEVQELKQEIEDLKANVSDSEKANHDNSIDEDLEHSNNKDDTQLQEKSENNPSLGKILYDDPYMDVSQIPREVFINSYNNPSDSFEQFLSDSVRQTNTPESEVPEAMMGIIGQGIVMAQQYGVNITSLPVFSAIQKVTFDLENYLNTVDATQASYGIVSDIMRIKDFNAFLDPVIANNYKDLKSTHIPEKVVQIHSYFAGKEQDVLNRWLMYCSGYVDPKDRFEDEYPGGIKAYTFLNVPDDGTAVYVTYLYRGDEKPYISDNISNLWGMPLNVFYMDMEVNGRMDYMPILHIVTGTGFKDF